MQSTLDRFLRGQVEARNPTRPYGDAGPVPLFSLGCESIFKSTDEADQEEARNILGKFLDEGGVLIDTAPMYSAEGHERLSEKRLGEVLPGRARDQFMIATKTDRRTRDEALEDLEGSLETLGLDHVDEWRLHHLDTVDELDEIFADGGAIEAMVEALDQGLVRRASISGHSDPDVLLEALQRYPFQSVLGAINVADKFLYSFQGTLLPYCAENGIPFTGMKLVSRGKLLRRGGLETFQDAFNYALSTPGVTTAIVGISNMEQLDRLIEAGRNYRDLTDEERTVLEDKVEPYAKDALFFRKGEEWPDDVEVEDLPRFVA